jgi:DNA-binding NarL/FixJ family response regulator
LNRVLIVDDQTTFRRHLRRLLERAGLTVIAEADDLSEAEVLLESLQPDLVVLDVMLPDINGIEGTSRLKKLNPHLRVILISAYLDRARLFQEAAARAGAETFITKDELDLDVVRAWGRASVE